MLDFETPTYVTAKEAQHMQSQVNTLTLSSVYNTCSIAGCKLNLKTIKGILILSINLHCIASCILISLLDVKWKRFTVPLEIIYLKMCFSC